MLGFPCQLRLELVPLSAISLDVESEVASNPYLGNGPSGSSLAMPWSSKKAKGCGNMAHAQTLLSGVQLAECVLKIWRPVARNWKKDRWKCALRNLPTWAQFRPLRASWLSAERPGSQRGESWVCLFGLEGKPEGHQPFEGDQAMKKSRGKDASQGGRACCPSEPLNIVNLSSSLHSDQSTWHAPCPPKSLHRASLRHHEGA